MDISEVQLNTLLAAIFKDGRRFYQNWSDLRNQPLPIHYLVPDPI
jgi:hypothetical protein